MKGLNGMTLEQSYRNECETMRLLIDEFEAMGAEYMLANAPRINSLRVADWNEYVRPDVVPMFLGYLTASLLVHIISLLEFRLPILIRYYLQSSGRTIAAELEKRKEENVLEWMERLGASPEGVSFDFNDELVRRMRAWMRVRDDEVHHGGYRSERTQQGQIDILKEVRVGASVGMYEMQFAACRNAIDDVENFFRATEKALSPRGS